MHKSATSKRSGGHLQREELEQLREEQSVLRQLGSVVAGTGGLRKFRHGAKGKGKRAGARVIYYYGDHMPIFLIAIYAKSEKTDMSNAEKKAAKNRGRVEHRIQSKTANSETARCIEYAKEQIIMARKSKIIEGLKEAVRYARGDHASGRAHTVNVPVPLDVKAIRQRKGLTQKAFATKYGFSLGTLKNFEQGHRAPVGASLTLLRVIEKYPDAVEAALAA